MHESVSRNAVVNLLIVSQYFWPESFRITDLARRLSRRAVNVQVLTGKPNYPEGTIYDGYTNWPPTREKLDAVEIFRVPLMPRGQGRARQLILNYLSFIVFGTVIGSWSLRGRPVDTIFVYGISPILQAIPAIFLKWRKRAKLVIWVQDLWPETLEATGFVRNRLALKLVGFVVRWIYRHSDLVLVQSRAFIEPVSRLCPIERIRYYPNSAEDGLDHTGALPACPINGMDDYFSIVFAGALGTAQALEVILDAAQALRQLPKVRFFLVGHGSRSEWAAAQIAQRGLNNVELTGRFPVETMPAIFAKSEALLVTLTENPIFAQTIPSKVQSYLAAGRPILGCIDGEGARVIDEARAGLTCPAMDVDGLVKNIHTLLNMPAAERAALGENGRVYFLENFESDALTTELLGLLGSLHSEKPQDKVSENV
jgi:glycosyltransferase involved in cell wall biosynthesis